MTDAPFYTVRDSFVRCGDVLFWRNSKRVFIGLEEVELLPVQKRYLEVLLLHRNRMLTPGDLYKLAGWDNPSADPANHVYVNINRLREIFGKERILYVRGVGYNFVGITGIDNKINTQDFENYGGVLVDFLRHRLLTDAGIVSLSRIENGILKLLAESSDHIFSRSEIGKNVWEQNGGTYNPKTNAIDAYINRLRNKIDDNEAIRTVKGSGYQFIGKNPRPEPTGQHYPPTRFFNPRIFKMTDLKTTSATPILRYDDVVLNLDTGKATRGGKEIPLVGFSFRMVAVLILNPRKAISPYDLFDAAKNLLAKGVPAKSRNPNIGVKNNVRAHMSEAKTALGEPLIFTPVFTQGYRLLRENEIRPII